ncbi:hypothetical protein ACF0H5_000332 [Mactra antiquata]
MYTTVPNPEISDHHPKPGDPLPEIIDHRKEKRGPRWVNRQRKEQLPYDTLKKHRDVLLEEEIKYKKQIRELEKEREELVSTYETTYQENQKLKSIVEHGPDAVKMKQLTKDKKEQKGLIEQLEDENKALNDKLKELEQRYDNMKSNEMKKNWDDKLNKVRKMREEEDAIPTQGPFLGNKLFKKRRIAIDDGRIEDADAYDLQLEIIESESQTLLRKIKQLKREKEQVDYTLLMGKGAVTKNAVVANAISEKLNRDLNKYAIRLEKLKLKHNRAKEFMDVVKKPPGSQTSLKSESKNEYDPFTQNSETNKVNKPKTYKTKVNKSKQTSADKHSAEKLNTSRNNGNMTERNDSIPGSVSPRVPFTKMKNRKKKADKEVIINPKHFDRPDSYTGLHKNAQAYATEQSMKNNEAVKPSSSIDGNILNNGFRDDMRIHKTKHRVKTGSQGSLTNPPKVPKFDLLQISHDTKQNGSNNHNGEAENMFESAARRMDEHLTLRQKGSTKSARTEKSLASKRTTVKNENVLQTYDEVLNDLRKNSDEPDVLLSFKQAYNERRAAISPEHINFNTKGRNVGGREAWRIIGNTGVRRDNYNRFV